MSYRKDKLVLLYEIENGELKQVANVAEELKTAKLTANARMKRVYRVSRLMRFVPHRILQAFLPFFCLREKHNERIKQNYY